MEALFVHVTLLSRFAVFAHTLTNGGMRLPADSRVMDLALRVGLTKDDLRIVLVNGKQGRRDTLLHENDTVVFVPPVAGGG